MNHNMTRREFAKTTSLAGLGILLGCSTRNRFDLVLVNGQIIDGTGKKAVRKDIGIKGDKIIAIDKLENVSTNRLIDATGLIIAPGFIDIHTHTDTELLVNPTGDSKILQGITTEVGGNCGSSPFPMTEEDRISTDEYLNEKYGLHANWSRTGEFLSEIEKGGTSFNYVTLTGNGDLRAFVVGKNDVRATADQMKEMKKILTESMEQGSFGLSTGLEYAPSSYANTEEIIELCKVVSLKGGIYATHMRNEDDTVEEAIEEALTICRKAEISTQISHLKACNQANWHKVDNMLRMIDEAHASGLPVKADRYPYIAYGTGMTTFLPLWARQGDRDDVLNRLENKSDIPKIEKYANSRGERIGGWERVLISSCHTDENKKWEGKTIREGSDLTGKSPFEFIRTLLVEEQNRVGIVGFAMDEENLKKVLSSPHVMIGSDGSAVSPTGKLGGGKPHPRFYGSFPRVLGKYCREEKYFDLPTAVAKMTSMPAEKLNLKQRGKIAIQYFADLVVFNPETVIDKATFTDPHQPPIGIEYVIVNGKLTVEHGKHTGALDGKVLRFGQV